MVRQWQELFHDRRYSATPMLSPDFVKVAEAYGIPGICVRHQSQVEDAIDAAYATDGPMLLEFQVEREVNVYPDGRAGRLDQRMITIRKQRQSRAVSRSRDEGMNMKHTLVALMQDQPGVLNRVASLFRRRGFNIDSLTVGHTETPGISRMTIVVDATRPASSR